jgi:hypothetical protein
MANPRKLTHSRGTSWEITYRIDGRMARRRLATRKQAVDELAKARVDIARGLGLLPVDAKATVAKYVEQWMATLQVRHSAALPCRPAARRLSATPDASGGSLAQPGRQC